MKIKLKTSLAGLNFSYVPGDVVDHDDVDARRLIRAGYAEPVKAPKPSKEETADGDEGETADDGGGAETGGGDEGEQRGEGPELFAGKPLAAYDGKDRKALIRLPKVDAVTADKILAARAARDAAAAPTA